MECKCGQIALDILKLRPRYLIAIATTTGTILFSPEYFSRTIGLFHIAQEYRACFGAIFLTSSVLWFVDRSCLVIQWLRTSWLHHLNRKRQFQKLRTLTEDEKKVLRYYLQKGTKTNVLIISDGVVNGLVSAGVITQAHLQSIEDDRFAFNISDFAWEYINKEKGVLNGNTDQSRTDLYSDGGW